MLLVSDLKELGVYSKIVRSGNGFVRVHFTVVEVGGRIRGRVISIEPVIELQKVESRKWKVENQNKFLLAGTNPTKNISTEVQWYEQPIISPFSNLSFFISQLTRAPAYSRV